MVFVRENTFYRMGLILLIHRILHYKPVLIVACVFFDSMTSMINREFVKTIIDLAGFVKYIPI